MMFGICKECMYDVCFITDKITAVDQDFCHKSYVDGIWECPRCGHPHNKNEFLEIFGTPDMILYNTESISGIYPRNLF